MTVLQHYYTSYKNTETGLIGFQTKARSPGITPEMESTIESLITYSVPPSLLEQNIETHPVALRYYYEAPERCFLLCSQSCGSDDNGRPGNFFAHTLVLPSDIFTIVPPISFWKSSFWCQKDRETRTKLFSLPVLPALDAEPSLNLDEVWEFLAQEERRTLLYKLLCAVVHSKKTYKRVVILDTTEHVVWWIAAVSMLLPPYYRPLLSFATYHHNPKQGRYLITGTTADSSFGSTQMDYRTFFVLNALTGETSQVDDSPYALLASQAAEADLYEQQLLPLFADYVPHFPIPTAIDEQLNLIALYARLHTQPDKLTLSQEELDAVHIALSSFEQAGTCSRQDIEELEGLQQVLSASARSQRSSPISREWERINLLLKKHRVQAPGEELRGYGEQDTQAVKDELLEHKKQEQRASEEVRQREVEAQAAVEVRRREQEQRAAEEMKQKEQEARSIENMLKQFVEALFQDDSLDKKSRFEQIQQGYREEALRTAINQPEYLHWLTDKLTRATPRHLRQIWQTLGRYILPATQSQEILISSLQEVGNFWHEQRADEGKELLRVIWQVAKANDRGWLQLAVNNYATLPRGMVELFYYSLVHTLGLDQRVPYRDILLPTSHMILAYEITSDISSVSAEQGITEMERWLSHARKYHYDPAPLVAYGLSQLQQSCTSQEWKELALVILRNPLFTPLPRNLEDQLVGLAFSSFTLAQLSLADLSLYARYWEHPNLSRQTSTTLAAIISLVQSQLGASQAQWLYAQMEPLSQKEYQRVVQQCIPYFFEQSVSRDVHCCLINAFFTWENENSGNFWQAYWNTFNEMLVHPQDVSRFVDILAFWFSLTPGEFQEPYVVQDFFMQLPSEFSKIQKERRFQDGIREFNKLATRKAWYPKVQDFFTEKKDVLVMVVSAGKNFIQALIGGNDDQKMVEKAEKEEERRRVLVKEMEKLFTSRAQDQHRKRLLDFYRKESSEVFWSCYWRSLKQALTCGKAESGLAALSFWFDDSYEKLEKVRYVPQKFFMDLPTILTEARLEGEKEFRETARRIDESAMSQLQKYSWYPMLRGYFIEGNKRA